MEIDLLLALCGFLGGTVLGICARWGRFCTLAAIEDFALGHDSRRLATWTFAIGIAILGVQLLHAATGHALDASRYISEPTSWLGNVVGGGLFGLGMALAGTCGYGVLARLGGGDFRALITLVAMAVAGYAAMRGVLAPLREFVATAVPFAPPSALAVDAWLSARSGAPRHIVGIGIGLLVCAVALRSVRLRGHARSLVIGLLVGLTVVSGWAATALLVDPFEPRPVESFTFTAPLGDSLLYLMISTGMQINFGIGSVAGVVFGAMAATAVMRQFRWEACEDAREIRRLLFGGALMGFGGVLAFGCTVGQGLSAASLLAWSAPVTLLSMYCGAWLGLHWLVDGQFGASWRERLSLRKQ
ncbi:MAG: YeeE/YedE family protein [Pseudomonadota bacterium]